MKPVRSMLFTPATRIDRLASAYASPADAVIADLEDAVPPEGKAAARAALVEHLRTQRPPDSRVFVRINALSTAHAAADLNALEGLPIAGIVVPKAEPGPLLELAWAVPVVALVETAVGVREAFRTASVPAVAALMIGTVDLAAEIGARFPEDEDALLHAASSIVLDSAAAGLAHGPIDGVCTAARDSGAVRREAVRARALGFRAKACIHPAQLDTVNAVFSPSRDEVAHARAVLVAYDDAARSGQGATIVGGAMVDAPVAARARRLLDLQATFKEDG